MWKGWRSSRGRLRMLLVLCPRSGRVSIGLRLGRVADAMTCSETTIQTSKVSIHTLSQTLAQNSALFALAAWISVSPAFSTASSSSFCIASSSFSLSAFSSSYSLSSQGRSTRFEDGFGASSELAPDDCRLKPPGCCDEPSPDGFRAPSVG